MARRKKLLKLLLGIVVGVILSQLFFTDKIITEDMCLKRPPKRELLASEPATPNKNFMFVGVMTAAKYVDTRAKSVYETWGREIPGKTVFYSSEFSYSDDVPLVALDGVDDSYPPQKKSFMMLKHMYENYIDQYEWFLRADDDVYIRTDRLEQLLRSVDSKKPWFIGQTGRGNAEEFGLLSLDSDENFCMGGPGVIFSRETLKRMAPYVDECLNNLYTTHEDVELGRCVKRFAGISCTWSYEASYCDCQMQVILYHNQSGQAAFSGDLKQKEVHRAITLHPVKHPEYMYRLHNYFKSLKIQDYHQEMIDLHRDVAVSMAELGYHIDNLDKTELADGLPLFSEPKGANSYLGDTKLLGIPLSITRYQPRNLDDVLVWDQVVKNLYSISDANPRRRVGSSLKEGFNDIVREVMEYVNSYSKQRGRIIDFKEVLYGYWRLDPIHGVDIILDLLLVYRKYRGHKMTVQVRRHAYIQQTFTGIMVREVKLYDFPNIPLRTSTTAVVPVHQQLINHVISTFEENLQPIFNLKQNKKQDVINILLTLNGRYEIFKRFIKMYVDVCINEKEDCRLIVSLYKSEEFDKTKALIDDVKNKYNSDIIVIEIDELFARAKALGYGLNILNNDDLILIMDVDMVFDSKSLQRVRLNTIKNQTIYFPIVYSLYNPKILNKTYPIDEFRIFNQSLIDRDNGFWRQFGFGILSIYKQDYLSLNGFNLQITGWGMEDVDFYDKSIKSDLKIVRSVDPSLIHVYHSVYCDINLDAAQQNMCAGTQASLLGSLYQLQKIYKQYQYLFR